jgi:hypothetical protein
MLTFIMWPNFLTDIANKFVTCEYASLTGRGQPIAFPCNQYLGNGTIDVSTGLTYPAKAERARHNPKVGLLFSDPTGSGIDDPAATLVLGHAAVRDANLQANTDRYVSNALRKYPGIYASLPKWLLKQSQWYFTRIWIEVTPLKVLWWSKGKLESRPEQWLAPDDLSLPNSDPAPAGGALAAWKTPPGDWHKSAAMAIGQFGNPDLSFVGDEGYPYLARALSTRFTGTGFELTLPHGLPTPAGSASLTFHYHPKVFTGQNNIAYVGKVQSESNKATFTIERQLADWSAGGGNMFGAAWSFMLARRKIGSRLEAECARRGQKVPTITL